jgi:hypothetical protein
MDTLTFKIRGKAPMLHHNSQLADPLNNYAKKLKKISGKRKKTDDDYADMARIEMLGGLYWNDSVGLHIPGENVEACMIGAAKFKKLGTAFKRSAQVVEHVCPLLNTGAPETPEEIADNDNFRFVKSVKVGTSRVMRTRPIFDQWETEFTVLYDPSQLQREDIIEAAESAGMMVGLGDWRPRFGKFEVMEVA